MVRVDYDYKPTDPIEIQLWAWAQMEQKPRLTCEALNRANGLRLALRDSYPHMRVYQDGEGVILAFALSEGDNGRSLVIAPNGNITRVFDWQWSETEEAPPPF